MAPIETAVCSCGSEGYLAIKLLNTLTTSNTVGFPVAFHLH